MLAGLAVFAVLLVALGQPSAAQSDGSALDVVGLDTRALPELRMSVTPPAALGLLPLPAQAFSARTSDGPAPLEVRHVPAAELDVVLLVELPERDDESWYAMESAAVEFALGLPPGARLTVLGLGERLSVVSEARRDPAPAVAGIGRLEPGPGGAGPTLAAAVVDAALRFDPALSRHQHLVALSSSTTLPSTSSRSAAVGATTSPDPAPLVELTQRGGTVQLVRLAPAGSTGRPPAPPPPLDRAQVIDVARAQDLVGVLDDVVGRIGNQYELSFRLPSADLGPQVELRYRNVAAIAAPVLPVPVPAPVPAPGATPAPGPAAPTTTAAVTTVAPPPPATTARAPAPASRPTDVVRPAADGSAAGAADGGEVARPAVLAVGLAVLCVGALGVTLLSGSVPARRRNWVAGGALGLASGVAAALLFNRGAWPPAVALLAVWLLLLVAVVVFRRGRRVQVASHLPQALRLLEGLSDGPGHPPHRPAAPIPHVGIAVVTEGPASRCAVCRTLRRAASGDASVALDEVRELAGRTGTGELAWVVDALELRPGVVDGPRVSAAAVATVADRLSHRRQLLTLSADYRIAAYSLPLLPLAAAALVGASSPSGVESFVTRPLGAVLVGLAMALSVLAWRSLRVMADVPPPGASPSPSAGGPGFALRWGAVAVVVSAALVAVAVPLPQRFLPLALAVVAGAAVGSLVPTWWARRMPVLRPEIDALDRTSILASAGFSPRRALAALKRVDPGAAAGIDQLVEVVARRPGRAEVLLRARAGELRLQERAAAQTRARRAPARIGVLAATCVVPATLCLLAGPVAIG